MDAKLINFSEICQKNPAKSAVFWQRSPPPPKFPVKSADFSKNLPLKILRNLTFSAKILRNWPIFPRILTFFPRKSREIGWFFRKFAPENPAKFCFFWGEISEALANITSLSFMNTCNTVWDESIDNPKKYLIKTYFLLLKFVRPEIKNRKRELLLSKLSNIQMAMHDNWFQLAKKLM